MIRTMGLETSKMSEFSAVAILLPQYEVPTEQLLICSQILTTPICFISTK